MTDLVDADAASDDPAAQPAAAAGPSSLRDIIVGQGLLETGIFVLLFTSETLQAPAGPTEDRAVAEVDRTAAGLGIDPAQLALFSEDAYLLQAALGEALVDQFGRTEP